MSNKDVVFKAVSKNGESLMFASAELKNDKEVVLAAVRKHGSSLEYASQKLKNNKDFIKDLVD